MCDTCVFVTCVCLSRVRCVCVFVARVCLTCVFVVCDVY